MRARKTLKSPAAPAPLVRQAPLVRRPAIVAPQRRLIRPKAPFVARAPLREAASPCGCGCAGCDERAPAVAEDDIDRREFGPFIQLIATLRALGFSPTVAFLRRLQHCAPLGVLLGAIKIILQYRGKDVPLGAIGKLVLEKSAIDCVCAMIRTVPLGDEIMIQLMRAYLWNSGPLALKNLDHYLEGSGKDLVEPVEEMLNKDEGMRRAIAADIVARAQAIHFHPDDVDDLEGDMEIFQPQYTVDEYKNALGNIDSMKWRLLGDDVSRGLNSHESGRARVEVHLRDPYQWHAQEGRSTQCIHDLFEKAKEWRGAKEFWEVGDGRVMIELPAHLIPMPSGAMRP